MNLYKILHINEKRLLRPSMNINRIKGVDIESLSKLIEYANIFHSYFHFEQSFAYLICAYLYKKMQKTEKEAEFLEKCLFQDHTNPIALDFTNPTIEYILSYDRHIMYEDDFLDFALDDHHIDPPAEFLDYELHKLISYFRDKPEDPPYKIAQDQLPPYDESMTHRLAIAHVLKQIKDDNIVNALDYALMAVRNLEDSHKAYHKYASDLYMRRSEVFDRMGQRELSKNDYYKAGDLFPIFS